MTKHGCLFRVTVEACLRKISSTSLQHTRSRRWSRIQIWGVELGRFRGGFRDQGVELGL